MQPDEFGAEEFTAEDRNFAGSRFSEVRDAIFGNPYQKVWGARGEPPLPLYQVTLASVLRGLLQSGRSYVFRNAAERAVDSKADLRWGADRKGFRRLVHPNGICLTGTWSITEANPYSGYFSQGSRGLIVGRYSTCCANTRRGEARSLSLVGKLFPTMDPNHAEPLCAASFITQQDLGGDYTDYVNDAELRNAPDTSAWRRGLGLPVLLISGIVFQQVDREPSIRQLYEIAELGKGRDTPTRTPQFMRLRVAAGQPRIDGAGLDFRDEIMAQIFDRGDPQPKRVLAFDIEVTDEGSTSGPSAFQRRTFGSWHRIGSLKFDNAVASYNGDFVLHFNHPTWRSDRNDPATATRVGGRKVG